MQVFDIRTRWSPRHTGIEGNEAADRLADLGATSHGDLDQASKPTVSGIRSIFRKLRNEAQLSWWTQRSAKLSNWYKKWNLDYNVTPLLELQGDFSWYHTKFAHKGAQLLCSCGRHKTPEHIVHCRKTTTLSKFRQWPQRPPAPPSSLTTGIDYLSRLMAKPSDFAELLKVTGFYSTICTC
jgi:hypothetical protein